MLRALIWTGGRVPQVLDTRFESVDEAQTYLELSAEWGGYGAFPLAGGGWRSLAGSSIVAFILK